MYRVYCLILITLFGAPKAGADATSHTRPYFLSGDVNLYLQPVNLTPAKRDGEITFVDNKAGFYVRSIRGAEAAAGVRSDFNYEHLSRLPSNAFIAVGLFPVLSTYVQFTGYARTESEADSFRYRRVPYSADDISKWREGDAATYEPQGGVAILAGGGNPLFGVYGKYIVTGGFRVFLEKKEADRVYVEIRSTNTKDLSIVYGGLALNAQKGVQRELSEGYAYEFRLDNPVARKAYEDFLKGHIVPAQEFASDYDSGISRNSRVDGNKVKEYASFYFGTPFIRIVGVAGATESLFHKEVRENLSGVEEMQWAANLSFNDIIFFGKKRRYVEGFSAQGATSTVDGEPATSNMSGEAFYERRANFGSVESLNEVLQELLESTGLDLLKVKMLGKGAVGYTEVRLSVVFQEDFIQHLIAHPGELDRYMWEALQTYSASEKAAEYERDQNNNDNSPSVDNPRDKITDAFIAMKKSLSKMASALRSGNTKEYLKVYADFGREMWRDPNIFRVIFNEAQKCGLTADFEVSGRKISRYLKRFSWLKKETCIL